MFRIPTAPQTAWQLIKSSFGLWKSSLKFVWPFSILLALFGDWYPYDFLNPQHLFTWDMLFTPEGLRELNTLLWHNLSMPGNLLGFVFVLVIHTLIIDTLHHSRGKEHYALPVISSILRKAWVFSMAYIVILLMVALGGVLFLIPGLILSVYVPFAPYLGVIEEQGIVSAIENSFKLVHKRWWFVANRLSVIFLVFLLFALFVCVISGGFLFEFTSILGPVTLKKITTTLGLVSNIFLYPLGHAFVLEMIYDLRMRKR